MTPPIHVGLAQHHKKWGRGRGLSQITYLPLLKLICHRAP